MKIFSRTLCYSGQFGSKIQEIPLESKLGGQSLEQFQSFLGRGTIVWTQKIVFPDIKGWTEIAQSSVLVSLPPSTLQSDPY